MHFKNYIEISQRQKETTTLQLAYIVTCQHATDTKDSVFGSTRAQHLGHRQLWGCFVRQWQQQQLNRQTTTDRDTHARQMNATGAAPYRRRVWLGWRVLSPRPSARVASTCARDRQSGCARGERCLLLLLLWPCVGKWLVSLSSEH